MPLITNIELVTATASDTVLGVQSGEVKRFAASPSFDALAASSGAALVGFVQSGAGAVARTAQDKGRETVSVKDFGAVGDGVTDDTAAIAAAIAYCDAVQYSERTLYWPTGNYLVDKVDLTDTDYITFFADGVVQITGRDDTAGFILGSTNYNAGTPASSTFTRGFKMIGGWWLIGNGAGQTYEHGLRLEQFVTCRFDNVTVSGDFAVAARGTLAGKAGVYLQYSYINEFNGCQFGAPGTTSPSYSVFFDNNNNNLNKFDTCRITGSSSANQIGARISGFANEATNCDVSGLGVGIDITGSRGGVFTNIYMEGVTVCVDSSTPALSKGNTFTGGFYEVLTNGTAFRLGSGTGSYKPVIIGVKVRGVSGGAARTFLDLGTQCYFPGVISPDLEDIDTQVTGTWYGDAGSPQPNLLHARWVSFPTTPVSSSDPCTLDAYKEGNWTPAITATVPGDLAVTYNAATTGTYTRVGRVVTAHATIVTSTFTHSTASGNLMISGLPVAATGTTDGQGTSALLFGGITKAGYTQIAAIVDYNAATATLYASGSAAAFDTVRITDAPSGGTVTLHMTLTYQTVT
jgi:hypothetical protein